ncbi:positive regulation of delayed rectifier potassium channel [Branchiostoma belcheri]|nr:positive regulation of delayed rectifier potassium channel [Branchiostoma belcheri]
MSGKLSSKDKLSSNSADQAETARSVELRQDSELVPSVTSSGIKHTTASPDTKAPPGAIKVHKVAKMSAFPEVGKADNAVSHGKTAELNPRLLVTETSASKVKDSDVPLSVETAKSSQVKKVTATDNSTNSKTQTASQGRRKRKTVREDPTERKTRKSGDGATRSRGTTAKDVQPSVKGRKAARTHTATKASHVKEEVRTDKESKSSLNAVPCTKQEPESLEQRATQGTESDTSGTEAPCGHGVAMKEQKPALTDKQEMTSDPPAESNTQITDPTDMEYVEGAESGEEEEDGTYNLTDLFDEEKQRVAWEQDTQQVSKHKKKKKKKAKWWERKRKRGRTGEAEEEVEEGEEEGKVKKKKREARLRPNYFVAIRVSTEEIHRGLKTVQEAVLEQEPNLQPAMIPLINMHITLLVTHLREEQVDRAKEALRLAKARLNPKFLRPDDRLVLTFQGLGTFRNDVVFAKIQQNGHLTSLRELAETVQTCFVEKEVCSKNDKGFEPHLTLMKMSRNFGKLRSKGIKKIDPKLYEEFQDERFGDQVVEGLQLCSMLKKKEADGYYHTEEQVMFGLGLEHILANSIASRAVREALLHLGCKLLEQQAKSNPEAALHTLSDHIARSVIQDALTALDTGENVIDTKDKVFGTDTMKAKVSELSESLGTALVVEAIQEASSKTVENHTSNKEDEKNVENIADPSEGNNGLSSVIESQNELSPLSEENVKDNIINMSQAQTGESLSSAAPAMAKGKDDRGGSCKLSGDQLKDLSEKLVKQIIEAAMAKVQEAEIGSKQ